jgi:hypothetical protein
MKIVSTIKTGFGSARTTFIPKRGLAIVTNTKDNFVTVRDVHQHNRMIPYFWGLQVKIESINRDSMKIVSTIKTGFGSARTTFIPKSGMYISIIG